MVRLLRRPPPPPNMSEHPVVQSYTIHAHHPLLNTLYAGHSLSRCFLVYRLARTGSYASLIRFAPLFVHNFACHLLLCSFYSLCVHFLSIYVYVGISYAFSLIPFPSICTSVFYFDSFSVKYFLGNLSQLLLLLPFPGVRPSHSRQIPFPSSFTDK